MTFSKFILITMMILMVLYANPGFCNEYVYWEDGFHFNGANSEVNALAKDSQGNIYIGGNFTCVGDVTVNYIAMWNGSEWIALGDGLNDTVNALAVDSSDNLYAGGNFTMAGDTPVSYIARWDGSSWSEITTYSLSDRVYALAFDPASGNLYAGGSFQHITIQGATCKHIAKMKYDTWSQVGGGMDNDVYALTVDGSGNLYAGGGFSTAGSISANKVAMWNGSNWNALGSGTNLYIYSLALDGTGNLYAGGYFNTAGGISASNIARWDGSNWYSLGSGTDRSVRNLLHDGSGIIYAGGEFDTAGGITSPGIASWNGSAWSSVGGGVDDSRHVKALLRVNGGNIFAGGSFISIGGVKTSKIAQWNGSSWSGFGDGFDDMIATVASDNSGKIYIGGLFSNTPDGEASSVASWNGSVFAPLGTGVDGMVSDLYCDPGDNLYAGGEFATAGGVSASNIAKWNGSAWSALGSGTDGFIASIYQDQAGKLYAGGDFATAGGVSADNIAMWNGSSWSPLGSGINSTVYDVISDKDGNIFAGGEFSTAGGVTVNGIGMWDGSNWSSLGSGMDGPILELAFDDSGNLYAGGFFTTAGGVAVSNIAMWNGSTWSSVGSGLNDLVSTLAFDRNGNLYAGGWNGDHFLYIWNGTTWTACDDGFDGMLYKIKFECNMLLAGGYFGKAGNKVSAYFAAKQPRVNLSEHVINASPGVIEIGNDNYGFYKPALSTSAGTTVTFTGDLPTTVTIDQADEIHMNNARINGAFTISPSGLEFGGDGASLTVEFSEDDAAALGIAWSEFRAARLTYPSDYATTNMNAASAYSLGIQTPAPVRIENGKQIYSITVPVSSIASTYGAVPKTLILPITPLNAGVNSVASNSIEWSWNDASDNEQGFMLYTGPGSGTPDTSAGVAAANVTTWSQGGLTPNTHYSFRVSAYNGMGESSASGTVSGWTLAATPVAPFVGLPDSDSLSVMIGFGDGNPLDTEFAICCTTTGQWVQPDGSLGANEAWQTAFDWSIITVTPLAANTSYDFCVKARNSQGAETGLSAPGSETTLEGSLVKDWREFR